jgi:aspartate/methionine/tyrosine aminotransferase
MSAGVDSFRPFAMERWQSLHEHEVEWNLADSAVRCAPLSLLLGPDDLEALAELELFYPEVNGTELLRTRIAATYDPTPSAAQVLVTVGAAEANALVCQTLLEPGDRVVVVEPGYRQVRGLAENLGCEVDVVPLRYEDGWELDADELLRRVTPGTRLFSVVNPNNPTGTILSPEGVAAVLEAVERSGCWLHADEVYRGSEHDGAETPSLWSQHPRVVCVNSLSKAYGLCGLRVGWLVGPPELVDACWRRHEYAVISTSLPGVFLAERALEPEKRAELLARQRTLVREGAELYGRWLAVHADLVAAHPSTATALSFPRVAADLPSEDVADTIRREASVLVIPGAMMGAESHLRLTFGFERDYLEAALDGIARVLRGLTGIGAA